MQQHHMGIDSGSAPSKVRIKWIFDIPLLLKSLIVIFVVGVIGTGLYLWQSNRISGELRRRADAAGEKQDYKKQAAWLSRCVDLDPSDKKSVIELGIAVDNGVLSVEDLVVARRRLATAIAATGELDTFKEFRDDLRKRLIVRLLQIGRLASGEWASEAEQQLFLLDPPPEDAKGLEWLCNSMSLQKRDGLVRALVQQVPDKKKEYWKWAASQSLGYVVWLAKNANPENAELLQAFASMVLQNPDWFEGGSESLDAASSRKEAEECVNKLASLTSNGSALLAAIGLKSIYDQAGAKHLLQNAYPEALKRLRENVASSTKKVSWQRPLDGSYTPADDWQLVMLAAADLAASENSRKSALAVLEQLMQFDSQLGEQQVEALYLAAGQIEWQSENQDNAVKLWEKALKLTPGSLPLERRLMLAWLQLAVPIDASTPPDEAKLALAESGLKRVSELIATRIAELSGPQMASVSAAQKEDLRKRLEVYRWEQGRLSGQMKMVRGDTRQAIQLLRKAFESPVNIPQAERVEAGQRLAECYAKLGNWDLAGVILDACVALKPEDKRLKLLAAEAWRNLGVEDSKLDLASIDDGSFSATMEIAQIQLGEQPANSGPNQRAQSTLEQARKRWSALSEADKILNPIWRVDLLELGAAGESTERECMRLEEIAEKYSDSAELLSNVTAMLAQRGNQEAADRVLQKLKALVSQAGKPDDISVAYLAEALVADMAGETAVALKTLGDAIAKLPKSQLQFAKTAARIAIRSKRYDDAESFLKNVDAKSLDVESLMLLAAIARTKNDEKSYARWENVLKELEGDSGCSWRYLEAENLLAQAVTKSPGSQLRRQLFKQAQDHLNEIVRMRPRWGIAHALAATIAIENKNLTEGIGLLRRAIRDGDQRTETTFRLARALVSAGQLEQAAIESKRLANNRDFRSPLAAFQVDLATRRGDFRSAFEIAKQAAVESPQQAESWLVAYQAADTASKIPAISDDERKQYRGEALHFLEQAEKITEFKDPRVWNAKFRFFMDAGEAQKAREVITLLRSSQTQDVEKLVVAADAYLAMNSTFEALECLNAAVEKDPKRAELHRFLAQLHERMGDGAATIRELEIARNLDKASPIIREQLAVAKAIYSEKIPWAEIEELLKVDETTDASHMRLVKAFIELKKGDTEVSTAAEKSLAKIANSLDADGAKARRFLASHYAMEWDKLDDTQKFAPKGLVLLDNAKQRYEEIISQEKQPAKDIYDYATLMLKAKDFTAAKRLVNKLDALGMTPALLQLKVRLAKLSNGETIDQIAQDWMEKAVGLTPEQSLEQVGFVLSSMNLNSESLEFLEQAYKRDAKKLPQYVKALANAKLPDQAISVCLERFKQDKSAVAAALLAEAALLVPGKYNEQEVEQVLSEALKLHGDAAYLWDSIATLRLYQRKFPEAVAMYEKAESLFPNQPRTVNNLAIALCELPMRGNDALALGERAVKIFNKMPEFLDTLAIVQSKLGRFTEAKSTLEQAISKSDDPRFRMRLASVLLQLNDRKGAEEVWRGIKLSVLENMEMPPDDRQLVIQLKQTLGDGNG